MATRVATARPRADAVRNRDAIVRAARAVFAERGLDGSLDEISRRAEVGNATLYRHFPTRCALAAAVFVDALDDVVAEADAALHEPDPWAGFERYVLFVCEMQATDRGFADLLSSAVAGAPELERLRLRAQHLFGQIADRAKASGDLRADFATEDLALMLIANAGLVRCTTEVAPTAWRRMVGYLLDSLRTSATDRPIVPSEGRAAIERAMRDQAVNLRCT